MYIRLFTVTVTFRQADGPSKDRRFVTLGLEPTDAMRRVTDYLTLVGFDILVLSMRAEPVDNTDIVILPEWV